MSCALHLVADRQSLEHWYNFFDKHPDYFKVGRVRNPYISPGAPIPPPCNHARNQKPGM